MQKTSMKIVLNRICGVAIVIALALTFALTGCSSNSNSQSSNQQSAPAEQKAPETITVQMTVADIDGNVFFNEAVEVEPEATAFNVLQESGIEYVSETGQFGEYVTTIDGIEATQTAGWTYLLNDEQPAVGADAQEVVDGDTVAWQYVNFDM